MMLSVARTRKIGGCGRFDVAAAVITLDLPIIPLRPVDETADHDPGERV